MDYKLQHGTLKGILECAAVWKIFAYYGHEFSACDYFAFDVMLFSIQFRTVSETGL
jgi:hypothetical protein